MEILFMQIFLEYIKNILYFFAIWCHNSPASPEGWLSEGSIMLYLAYYVYLGIIYICGYSTDKIKQQREKISHFCACQWLLTPPQSSFFHWWEIDTVCLAQTNKLRSAKTSCVLTEQLWHVKTIVADHSTDFNTIFSLASETRGLF